MAEILKQGTEATSLKVDSATTLVGFNLSDLAEEGRQKIESCRTQIVTMLAEAEAEASRIREAARREGYSAGLEQAEVAIAKQIDEQAEQRSRRKLARLQDSVEQLYQTHEGWMQDYAELLSDLAISVAEKVVRQEVSISKQLVLRWVNDALTSTRLSKEVTLSLHPDTMSEIEESLNEMLSREGMPELVKVVQDAKLDRHEVKVTQAGGEIRAGMLAQLDQLGAILDR